MSKYGKQNAAVLEDREAATNYAQKKRLLFVDDEPLILELFRALFEPMAAEWELSFAPNATEALALMEKETKRHPFEVVVSDMRMPGMSGAQFLSQVMQRYPQTARLILSGYADQEEVAKSVGAVHQFLMKPCDVKTLQSTLSRVCALDVFLRNEKLKALATKLTVLPSVPTVYFRVLKELQLPNATTESIGAIIAEDPGMTAKILQLVNSAFFGIARKVGHPAEAVQLLGVNTVRSLALCIHAFSCFEQSKSAVFSIGKLWSHSLATGLAAKQIAQWSGAEPPLADEAFIGGLLHDLGKLVLAANMSASYAESVVLARNEKLPDFEAERRVFNATHAEVGAYLLGLWGLPVPIVEAVALHHTPAKSIAPSFAPLTAVHVANVLAHERCKDADEGVLPELDLSYLCELGLDSVVPEWRKKIADTAFDQAA